MQCVYSATSEATSHEDHDNKLELSNDESSVGVKTEVTSAVELWPQLLHSQLVASLLAAPHLHLSVLTNQTIYIIPRITLRDDNR